MRLCALVAVAVVVGPGTRAVAAPDPAGALPAPPSVSVGEVPLFEPIAPVSSGLPSWAIAGVVGFGLADPFFRKATFGVAARRGFGAVAGELFGVRAVSWASPGLSLCSSAGSCTVPGSARLAATPGNLTWYAGAGVQWRAAEGKLSVAGLSASRFSLELGAAGAAVAYRISDGTDRTDVAPGLRLGLGVASDVLPAVDLRAEVQWLLYAATLRGDRYFERQLLAGLALSWRVGGAP